MCTAVSVCRISISVHKIIGLLASWVEPSVNRITVTWSIYSCPSVRQAGFSNKEQTCIRDSSPLASHRPRARTLALGTWQLRVVQHARAASDPRGSCSPRVKSKRCRADAPSISSQLISHARTCSHLSSKDAHASCFVVSCNETASLNQTPHARWIHGMDINIRTCATSPGFKPRPRSPAPSHHVRAEKLGLALGIALLSSTGRHSTLHSEYRYD